MRDREISNSELCLGENTFNTKAVPSNDVDLLIIDDEAIVLRTLIRIFSKNFREVITTQSTDEGLEIIGQRLVPYSFVISDIDNHLSTMSGLDLATKSLSARIQKQIPLLIMSGDISRHQKTIQRLMDERTIYGYAQKPTSILDFRKIISGLYQTGV